MARYISLEELMDYGQANEGEDPTILQFAIEWAESTFERLTGSEFFYATVTDKPPLLAYIDKYGWLYLIARTLAPVLTINTLRLRYLDGSFNGPLTWQTDNIILPRPSAPPQANAWEVRLLPDQQLWQAAPSQILVQWAYTGGYEDVPEGLKMIILRMAWWKYKLREMPMGVITNPAFGMMKSVQDIPADIMTDIMLWKRTSTGG